MIYRTARVAPEKAVFRPALPLRSTPGSHGTNMPKLSYTEQLKHPNWQRKRLETLEAAGWACQKCECKDVTLHVHHRRYVKGRLAWEYDGMDLEVLCEPCHSTQHEKRELLDALLVTGDSGYENLDLAIGLLSGFLEANLALHEDLEAPCKALGREFVYGQIAGVLGDLPSSLVAKLLMQIDTRSLNPAQRCFVEWMQKRKEG